ncbi:MAG: peptidyl-prolyl cis-trans isomerase [Balneola sp.]
MKSFFCSILIICSIAGCKTSIEPNTTIFARVNDETLSLKEALGNIPPSELEYDSIQALINYKENWIQRRLILQEIKRLNLSEIPEVQEKLVRAEEEALLISFQEAILSSISDEISITDEEISNYYQKNKDKFLLDQRYLRFRHVIAKSLNDANNAKRDLMRGIDWEQVANDYSLNSDLVINNSTRFWPEATALKEFDILNRYLRIIGVSELSLTEKINNNYHFVQLVEERSTGEHPDLDWLFEQISEWLILEKKRVAYNTYVKNLYLAAEANNEIHNYDVLPKTIITSDSTSDSLNSN